MPGSPGSPPGVVGRRNIGPFLATGRPWRPCTRSSWMAGSAKKGTRSSKAGPAEVGPSRSAGRRVLRLAAMAATAGGVAGLGGLAVGAWAWQRHVVDEPGSHLAREHVLSIIAQESPVYYRDGETRLGV